MSFYSQYKGQSFSRVLWMVEQVCGVMYAETVKLEPKGKLTYHNKPFASFEWKQIGEEWIPLLTFVKGWDDGKYWEKKQSQVIQQLEGKKDVN